MSVRALLLAALAGIVLAGCTVGGHVVFTSIGQAVGLVILVALAVALVLWRRDAARDRRQASITPDSAVAALVCDHALGLYVAGPEPDPADARYSLSMAGDPLRALGWYDGGLTDVRLVDAIPVGPDGDAARAAYAAALHGTPSTYVRAETEPGTGRVRWMRYRISRTPDGKRAVLATDETEAWELAAAYRAEAERTAAERDAADARATRAEGVLKAHASVLFHEDRAALTS